jgi:dihydroorotate dehydrogenase
MDVAAKALRLLPAEDAHKATIRLASQFSSLLPRAGRDDACLAVSAFGLAFSNPIGLAAGFDKNAEVPDAMLKLGFGFVECGSITPRPQSGNPQPRLFRLPEDGAVINRMGFNNEGMEAAGKRLAARARNGIVGINIGANKDSADRTADYVKAFAKLAPFANYVTANISSPNTPGLRGLQNKDELRDLLSRLTDARARAGLSVPLLLKIAPDLDESAADDIAAVVMASGIEGLIVSNTTLSREGLTSPLAKETGGLSGKPLFASSTRLLRLMHARLEKKITLVGVGGISSGTDAYEKIRAGATLVQLYTALALNGPGLITRLKRDLAQCLKRDGYSTVAEAVGKG